jgi:hypothetical protein
MSYSIARFFFIFFWHFWIFSWRNFCFYVKEKGLKKIFFSSPQPGATCRSLPSYASMGPARGLAHPSVVWFPPSDSGPGPITRADPIRRLLTRGGFPPNPLPCPGCARITGAIPAVRRDASLWPRASRRLPSPHYPRPPFKALSTASTSLLTGHSIAACCHRLPCCAAAILGTCCSPTRSPQCPCPCACRVHRLGTELSPSRRIASLRPLRVATSAPRPFPAQLRQRRADNSIRTTTAPRSLHAAATDLRFGLQACGAFHSSTPCAAKRRALCRAVPSLFLAAQI